MITVKFWGVSFIMKTVVLHRDKLEKTIR